MSKHILLVDDDALMRRSLAFGLEQAGYHVSSAANAEDALALARLIARRTKIIIGLTAVVVTLLAIAIFMLWRVLEHLPS